MQEDNNANRAAGISFSWKGACVHIYQNTIKALGSPRYVRFLFDDQKKHLAVQVCSPQESGAIRVSVEKRKINYISSLVMLRLVWKVCNWKKKDTLRCYGKIYEKNQVVDFDLNHVERITEEEFMEENE